MIKEIQLYEYQKDMLRQIEDAFGTHQSVMVQMPTGTGKTVLISEVVKREERRVKNSFTLHFLIRVKNRNNLRLVVTFL